MANKRIEISDEMLQRTEELAAVGYLVHLIANALQISKTTFYTKAELTDSYKKGRAVAIEKAAKALFSKAEEGDTTAAIFLLKTVGYTRDSFEAEKPGTAKEVNGEMGRIYAAMEDFSQNSDDIYRPLDGMTAKERDYLIQHESSIGRSLQPMTMQEHFAEMVVRAKALIDKRLAEIKAIKH